MSIIIAPDCQSVYTRFLLLAVCLTEHRRCCPNRVSIHQRAQSLCVPKVRLGQVLGDLSADRCKSEAFNAAQVDLSDRNSVRMLSAPAKAFGNDVVSTQPNLAA